MTQNCSEMDFMKIVATMKSIWPSESFLPDEYSIKVWYKLLSDIPYTNLGTAVHMLAVRTKFPPSVAEIREMVCQAQSVGEDWSEAWGNVLKAIGRFGQYQEEEAMAVLSDKAAAVVRQLGWKSLCQSDNLVADRAHFQRAYETLQRREKDMAVLPATLKDNLAQLQQMTQKVIGDGSAKSN